MFEHNRIPLLRHDRADLNKAVVDIQRIGFLCRSHQQIMRHAAEIDRQRLHGKGNIGQVLTAADRVLRAKDDVVKPQQFSDAVAVQ